MKGEIDGFISDRVGVLVGAAAILNNKTNGE